MKFLACGFYLYIAKNKNIHQSTSVMKKAKKNESACLAFKLPTLLQAIDSAIDFKFGNRSNKSPKSRQILNKRKANHLKNK